MPSHDIRVVFDAFWWVNGPISNRTVQKELILAWLRDNPRDDATLVVPLRDLETVRDEVGRRAAVVGTRLRPHAAAAAIAVPRFARRAHAHTAITHNFAPLTGRSAVFVHDVLFQTNPEWFTRAERCYFALMPLLMPRAEVVLSSSANEARRISANNRRAGEVVPIGLGIGGALLAATPRKPAQLAVNEFLLCVGRLNVRKNLAFSIEAALRSGVLSADRPLVVVGEAHGRAAELSPAGREAVERGLVVLLGAVDDAELAWLYGHALLFLFMTRDEGFGLPPVEARYFGCPVLASDIPVLRETVGDHARFADPTDLHAVASAVTDAIETPWPNEHVAAATWSECAGRMRAAVLEQRRRRCAGRSSVLALTRNSRR